MSLGIIILVHTALNRAEKVIRHWSNAGCPVSVHVDISVRENNFSAFVDALSDLKDIRFVKRHRCEWGTWGIVEATQSAAELLLHDFPNVQHVYLTSGSCLPIKSVDELQNFLEKHPNTDFIESATIADVSWIVGGLGTERFTLYHPFNWRKQRSLFDKSVNLQRKLKINRKVPLDLIPHMGSQWWCLTRQTLSAILSDPDREVYERFFKTTWIPDESYFQTLARLYSINIESRSLTLSKFDYQGKPYIFYDDHLHLLRKSDCFVARKIWPKANRLYDTFLDPNLPLQKVETDPLKIDKVFSKAMARRTKGRAGLFMQSRNPRKGFEHELTANEYLVLEGLSEVFVDFENWLDSVSDYRVHGHLYAPERVNFAGGVKDFVGCQSESARIRDHHPRQFLTNLIWNTRGEKQCFQYGPSDDQSISWEIAKDPNAIIQVITGAWAIPLFQSNKSFSLIREEAAKLQKYENDHINALTSYWAKARVNIWSLSDFVQSPIDYLQVVIDDAHIKGASAIIDFPKLVDLTGFRDFVQRLKNQGMHPYMIGEFPTSLSEKEPVKKRTPYLVR